VYRIDVTRKIIRPKIKKYKVMRLDRVGFQKEQKHLKCSMIFMWVTFDEIVSHHIASYGKIVKSYICIPAAGRSSHYGRGIRNR
jgi:hypothetical protein